MTAAGHLPAPSQVAARVWVPLAQLSRRQLVSAGQGRQAPEPLQVPSFEQSPLATALGRQRDLGSATPASTLVHVPAAMSRVPLQVRHKLPVVASAQEVLQQTLSVQMPLWHCRASLQAAPFAFRPHELLMHVLGGVQSAVSVAGVQLDLQAPLAQAKAPQGCVVGVRQAPLPSQLEAGVSEDVVAQTGAAQLRPAS